LQRRRAKVVWHARHAAAARVLVLAG
jgi:hypothetical protein